MRELEQLLGMGIGTVIFIAIAIGLIKIWILYAIIKGAVKAAVLEAMNEPEDQGPIIHIP